MAIVITNLHKLPKNCLDNCPCYTEDSGGCCQAVSHWGLVPMPRTERPNWCPLMDVDLGGEL